MNLDDYRTRVAVPLNVAFGYRQYMRVDSGYRDVLVLARMADEVARTIGDKDVFSIGGPDRNNRITELMEREERHDVLHRAAIVASGICMELLIHDAAGRPNLGRKSATVEWFARNRLKKAAQMDDQALSKAYALTQYRNKMIVHAGSPRSSGKIISATKNRRLVSIGLGAGPNPQDVETIHALRAMYLPSSDETNFHMVKNRLFLEVPVIRSGEWNQDRDEIDDIVDRYGATSPTIAEAIDILDNFSLRLVDLLPL